MMKLAALALATVACSASAMKAPKARALALRGGMDSEDGKRLLLASSAFVFLPAPVVASALVVASARAMTKAPEAGAGAVRRGLDAEGVATALGLASSAFILLPAGRDIVSHATAILPGEAATRPLLTMAHEAARSFMWGVWGAVRGVFFFQGGTVRRRRRGHAPRAGLNHCFISFLKIRAIRAKDKPMLRLLWPVTAATFLYCLAGNGPVTAAGGDLGGFVAVCAVQTLAIGYLAVAH